MVLHRNDKCQKHSLCTTKPFEIEYRLILFQRYSAYPLFKKKAVAHLRDNLANGSRRNGKKYIVPILL